MKEKKGRAVLVLSLLCAVGLFVGCSSSNKQASSSSFDPDTGRHTAGWSSPAAHGAAAKTQANGFTVCQECHADDFSGGVSAVSCKSCHTANAPHAPAPWIGGSWTHTNTNPANAPICAQCHTNAANTSLPQPAQPAPAGTAPGCFNNTLCHAAVGHAAGWNASTQHGAAAKSAPTYTGGFASCETCHGSDFSGGLVQTSCFTCHGVNAPHAPKPWNGISSAFTHTTTDVGNAPACAQCHTNGANSSLQPSPPAAAGTAPGCFNNTLCHAQMGHPTGWDAFTQHGAAAKSAPTSTGGFALCKTCHGTDFSGGTVQISCFTCHKVNAPHAPKPWSGATSTWQHSTTDPGNAPVCATCHTNGANSSLQPSQVPPAGALPDCFNNTLCHAQMGHPTGWSDATQHGATAKAAPTTASGFALCETCHGSDFSGGVTLTSCFTCHGGSGPHPTSWITGSYTHTTTDTGNASVCALCHANGANSPIAPPSPPAAAGTAPGCFNSTLCHATPTCGSCHGIPPSGTVFPNVAGNHAPHISLANIACSTCHSGAGSGTTIHQNGVVDVILDPTYNAKSGAATYNAASLTCSNVSCHGGQTTPNWQTGTINVNTQCTLCHIAGTTQYNGYYSGHHSTHVVGEGFACTVCHDTTKLAVSHLTSLNTLFTEATASASTRSALNFNGTTCNPSAGGLTGCHSSHTW